ncbi:hypothetical protein GE09DRAFT_505949 [Coniochaeta sp. 2T2.1]|nr:hypothetical protein GE09DRAFT_505949 [Coniochaeta sp. 2T2.1]
MTEPSRKLLHAIVWGWGAGSLLLRALGSITIFGITNPVRNMFRRKGILKRTLQLFGFDRISSYTSRVRAYDPPPPKGLVICMSLLSDQAKTNPQAEAAFLSRLPLEIRLQIYEEVIPAEKQLWIRVAGTSGTNDAERLAGAAKHASVATLFEHCPAESHLLNALYSRNASAGCCRSASTFWQCLDMEREMHFINFESVSLMLSCKRIYIELFPLWTFCFNYLDDLEAFAACVSSLGPALPHVRSVHLAPRLPRCFYYNPYKYMVYSYDLEPGPPSPPCQRHADEWMAQIHRLNQALRRFPGRLTNLTLDFVPVDDSGSLSSPGDLLESVMAVEGVPMITAEAYWGDGLAGTSAGQQQQQQQQQQLGTQLLPQRGERWLRLGTPPGPGGVL